MTNILRSVVLLALSTVPAHANTLSKGQLNALDHIAHVIAITSDCPEYRANVGKLVILAKGIGIDIERQAEKDVLLEKTLTVRVALRAADPEIGCLLGWSLYGPGGNSVPNLIIRK